jgi:hypothetical protein
VPALPLNACIQYLPPSAPSGYQLEALEAAVPGLEVLPLAFPLDRPALLRLVKDNFRLHRGGVTELSEGYTTLDQVRGRGFGRGPLCGWVTPRWVRVRG